MCFVPVKCSVRLVREFHAIQWRCLFNAQSFRYDLTRGSPVAHNRCGIDCRFGCVAEVGPKLTPLAYNSDGTFKARRHIATMELVNQCQRLRRRTLDLAVSITEVCPIVS